MRDNDIRPTFCVSCLSVMKDTSGKKKKWMMGVESTIPFESACNACSALTYYLSSAAISPWSEELKSNKEIRILYKVSERTFDISIFKHTGLTVVLKIKSR